MVFMKHCMRCQTELEDSASFCPECGMPQEKNEAGEKETSAPPAPAAAAPIVQGASATTKENQPAAARRTLWEKAGYIGLGMTAVSVLLPLVSISLLSAVTSLMNVSQMLSFLLLALCCFAACYFKEEKYNIPLSVSLGILVTFGGLYYKLYTALGDMKKTMALLEQMQNRDAQFVMQFLHSFADKLIGTGIGFYFLLAGALLTVVACASCRLAKKQAGIAVGSLFTECRLALMETAEIGSQKIPAYILTVLTIAVLVFAVMNIEIFTLKVASLL